MEKRREYKKQMAKDTGKEDYWNEKIEKISTEIDNFDRMTLLRDRKKTKLEE